jgi:hypothetical protein
MSLPNMKKLRFAIVGFAAALSVGVAIAQSPGGIVTAQSPDGSPGAPKAQATPSPSTIVVSSCGSQFFSRVITQNNNSTFSSTAFINFASFSFSVPSGAARCIKVLFTAEAACSGPSSEDFCYVRAIINGTEMHPQGGSFQVLQSEDSTAAGHAYEWFHRVGAGNYTVTIQGRTSSGSTFFLDDWTADFMLTT